MINLLLAKNLQTRGHTGDVIIITSPKIKLPKGVLEGYRLDYQARDPDRWILPWKSVGKNDIGVREEVTSPPRPPRPRSPRAGH